MKHPDGAVRWYCQRHEGLHLRVTPQAEMLNRERLAANISPGPNGPDGLCWIYTGQRTTEGYGRFTPEGGGTAAWYAHRVAWDLLMGGHAHGLELDHLCNQPSCIAPYHLRAVNPATNQKRKGGAPLPHDPRPAARTAVRNYANQYRLPHPDYPTAALAAVPLAA